MGHSRADFSSKAMLLGVAVFAGAWLSAPGQAEAAKPKSYSEARDVIDQIYRDYPVTTYCGCVYNGEGHDIQPETCGLDVSKYANRADRVEWEHVMPASYFGHMMTCWQRAPSGTSGREHCRETSDLFNELEADLVNLQPSVGALNAIRSNHAYGVIPGEARDFGACDFEDDGETTEPPPWARGDIARIWFYMNRVYRIPIGDSQRRMLEEWADADPPDEWERVRADRIGRIQGREFTIQFQD